jgi:hypothetical protein
MVSSIFNPAGPVVGQVIAFLVAAAVLAIPVGMIASPFMGIVRGVKNSDVTNAILSFLIPIYGLVYFFVARKPAPAPQ